MSETYNKTVKGTLGAGVSTLFGGASKYYVLEHKVSSKYHKQGEAQEIIVDYAEIGREWDCAVRFDESFNTVSRRHAAIVKKDDNWKLVQLSQTNSTFLNGHKVTDEWYLQNGDEIQLSVNGPKLGFIIPDAEDKKTSMNLTHRLSLFGQQALRPYRNVIIIMGVILLLVIGAGVGYGVYAHKKAEAVANELQQQLIEQQEKMIQQTEQLITLTHQLDSAQVAAYEAQVSALKAEAQAAKDEKALKKLNKRYDELQTQVQQMLDEKKNQGQEEENEYQKVDDYINSHYQQ